jgi:hypothetical protein
LKLECFVNDDFAVRFKQDPNKSPSSTKSCTGYVIRLAGNPLIWKSKLQAEVSLSTLESEYAAISQAMHQLIPICLLIIELLSVLQGQQWRISTGHESSNHCSHEVVPRQVTSLLGVCGKW